MISRNILAKGQIVIPKTIRELIGINVGDEILIDVKDEKIILSKKQNAKEIFLEVSNKKSHNMSMKKIKKELAARYEED